MVFISYAHADRAELLPFVEQLQPLVEREQLNLFFDAERLQAGDVWDDKLQAALQSCELFLLFASPASLASAFCIQRELLVAIDRQRRGQCRVVPVVLRPCDWPASCCPTAVARVWGVTRHCLKVAFPCPVLPARRATRPG